jgi:hypothetical protein
MAETDPPAEAPATEPDAPVAPPPEVVEPAPAADP